MTILLCLICFFHLCKNLTSQQKWQENAFLKVTADTLWAKNLVKIALPRPVYKIHAFLFYGEIKDDRKNAGKTIVDKKCQITTCVYHVSQIISPKSLYSKIHVILHFTQKFRMVIKNGEETIFLKRWQYNFAYNSKLLYLAPFQS